jgi:hypothetical protein
MPPCARQPRIVSLIRAPQPQRVCRRRNADLRQRARTGSNQPLAHASACVLSLSQSIYRALSLCVLSLSQSISLSISHLSNSATICPGLKTPSEPPLFALGHWLYSFATSAKASSMPMPAGVQAHAPREQPGAKLAARALSMPRLQEK